jgi:hypothetical protein
VGSIINIDMFGYAWRWVRGTDTPTASPSSPPTTPETGLSLKAFPGGAITFQAPEAWEAGRARFNPITDQEIPGDAVKASLNPSLPNRYSRSEIFIGASRTLAKTMRVPTNGDPIPMLTKRLQVLDWTEDDCKLVNESPSTNPRLPGVMREWHGCGSLEDVTFWDVWATTPGHDAVVYIQFTFRDDLNRSIAEQMLQSIVVSPPKLSG